MQQEETNWTEFEVSQGEPRRAQLMWFHIRYLHAATTGSDAHNLCLLPEMLDVFLQKYGSALKWRWRQQRFRALYYRIQASVRELNSLVLSGAVTCPTSTHTEKHPDNVRTLRALRTQYQGPHCVDMAVYMALKQRVTNDVALRIFDYL
jgi:hypothetical protein